MSDDLISGNCLYQLDLVVSLEVGHLVLDLSNDFEVLNVKQHLGVYVDGDGNLTESIFDQ